MLSTRAVRLAAVSGGGAPPRAVLLPKNTRFRSEPAARFATATTTIVRIQPAGHTTSSRVSIGCGTRYSQSSSNTRWAGAGAAVVLATVLGISLTSCDAPFRVKQNYDIVKLLGEGAYGRVFLATRKSDGTQVALKAIARDAISNDEFTREVNALQLLSRNGGHPHICRLHDLHDDGDKFYYIALELIGGGELFEHLIRNGPYSGASRIIIGSLSRLYSNFIIFRLLQKYRQLFLSVSSLKPCHLCIQMESFMPT